MQHHVGFSTDSETRGIHWRHRQQKQKAPTKTYKTLVRRALHCHSWTCLQVEVIQIIEPTWRTSQKDRAFNAFPTQNTLKVQISSQKKRSFSNKWSPKLDRLVVFIRIISHPITKLLKPSLPPNTHILGARSSGSSSTALWEKRAEGALPETETSVQVSAWRKEWWKIVKPACVWNWCAPRKSHDWSWFSPWNNTLWCGVPHVWTNLLLGLAGREVSNALVRNGQRHTVFLWIHIKCGATRILGPVCKWIYSKVPLQNGEVKNPRIKMCMYVCMHACMYACMHACMYVCVCIYIYTSVRDSNISGWPLAQGPTKVMHWERVADLSWRLLAQCGHAMPWCDRLDIKVVKVIENTSACPSSTSQLWNRC